MAVDVNEAILQVKDVVPQCVVLVLYGLEAHLHLTVFSDLLLQLLYVPFFPLTECPLW